MPLPLIQKYTDIFVETGTFYGEGVQMAIDAGYKQIVSIELFDKYYDIGINRFKHNDNVKIVHGDSGLILGEVIKNFKESITFWLDGHFSGEGTGFGIKEFPLMEELAHIKNHPLKTHVVLIDDLRCWKEYNKELNLNSVMELIISINPKYEFYIMDGEKNPSPNDILVCKIG
jgi:hypothetical protein